MGIAIINIRRSRDRVIFIMEIRMTVLKLRTVLLTCALHNNDK